MNLLTKERLYYRCYLQGEGPSPFRASQITMLRISLNSGFYQRAVSLANDWMKDRRGLRGGT